MNKTVFSLLIGSTLFTACSKESFTPPAVTAEPCQLQTVNPSGRSYDATSVVDFNCTDKHCGLLPLSTKNYWIYEDSIFSNGSFVRVQFDTLRYTSAKISTADGLVWWNANFSVGLPATMYSNESAVFTLTERLFTPGIVDARKDYIMPEGDSVKYLSNFEDVAAPARSVRLREDVKTSMGSFSDCILFEKNARFFRKDQVFFKPGLGVVKYIQEKTPQGQVTMQVQLISTLVAVHIE